VYVAFSPCHSGISSELAFQGIAQEILIAALVYMLTIGFNPQRHDTSNDRNHRRSESENSAAPMPSYDGLRRRPGAFRFCLARQGASKLLPDRHVHPGLCRNSPLLHVRADLEHAIHMALMHVNNAPINTLLLFAI
jgi:hypothetical protein